MNSFNIGYKNANKKYKDVELNISSIYTYSHFVIFQMTLQRLGVNS